MAGMQPTHMGSGGEARARSSVRSSFPTEFLGRRSTNLRTTSPGRAGVALGRAVKAAAGGASAQRPMRPVGVVAGEAVELSLQLGHGRRLGLLGRGPHPRAPTLLSGHRAQVGLITLKSCLSPIHGQARRTRQSTPRLLSNLKASPFLTHGHSQTMRRSC
jgi:hypothetical protein